VRKQFALAHELGVHESAITRWKEDGPMGLSSAIRLCAALDISLDWLLLGRGSLEEHKNAAETPIDDAATMEQRVLRLVRIVPRPALVKFLDFLDEVVAASQTSVN
jgi:transcriptional regulator with XRE-family HTH domain